ncbi:adenine phosphoribosyltransferase [Pedobacter deserti]|uniref:adenine phosphoribosyltransferase n=1 Tax=Pedobacter deserti TaxID=2817382 RepID=UPI00210B55AC|nr:adenine phosphoribosyltransferase [Pedobacter sp. SYSU D00382]
MIENAIRAALRDVHDFPKPGIVFKDITPILKDPVLCARINEALFSEARKLDVDVVAGIESRGFLFGPALAQSLAVPFVPIRKSGKLPYTTVEQSYDLEYGSATIECHADAFEPGQKVLIHDDLLATGGTVVAASQLVAKLQAVVAGYSFVIALDFLNGRDKLKPYADEIHALISF